MWKDLIGHKEQIEQLRTYCSSGRRPHALLFEGQFGVGKTRAAVEFFKALNCLESTGDPCDVCRSCIKADSNAHPDLIKISPVSQWIQIQDVRDVLSEIGLRPYEARHRVVIIEPAEQLNKPSANALLKTLEEPPEGSIIVLVSHKPGLILPTIVSRCQIIRFSPLNASCISCDDIDPVLLRLSSGSIGSFGKVDSSSILKLRSAVLDIFRGGDAFPIPSTISGEADAKDLLGFYLVTIESIIRDIMVINGGGDNLVNDELRLVPLDHIAYGDIERICLGIQRLRKGMNENMNMKVAFSELFILLSELAARS